MKTAPLFLLSLVFISGWIASCDKSDNVGSGEVAFYLLDDFDTLNVDCAIDESTVVLESEELIEYSWLLSYDPVEYVFRISDEAVEVIENMEHSVFGIPFGVAADGELIYTGYFWPSYSSLICQWITIDPLLIGMDNGFHVRLGYPGQIDGVDIPDRRNDPRILEIFRSYGKLVE
jgi:hypothetical protein